MLSAELRYVLDLPFTQDASHHQDLKAYACQPGAGGRGRDWDRGWGFGHPSSILRTKGADRPGTQACGPKVGRAGPGVDSVADGRTEMGSGSVRGERSTAGGVGRGQGEKGEWLRGKVCGDRKRERQGRMASCQRKLKPFKPKHLARREPFCTQSEPYLSLGRS